MSQSIWSSLALKTSNADLSLASLWILMHNLISIRVFKKLSQHLCEVFPQDRPAPAQGDVHISHWLTGLLCFCFLQVGPQNTAITVSPNATVEVGSTVVLYCMSESNPPAKILWGKRQDDKSVRHIMENHTLTIPHAQLSDSGLYICEAINAAVNKTQRTTVSISIQGMNLHDIDFVCRLCSIKPSISADYSMYCKKDSKILVFPVTQSWINYRLTAVFQEPCFSFQSLLFTGFFPYFWLVAFMCTHILLVNIQRCKSLLLLLLQGLRPQSESKNIDHINDSWGELLFTLGTHWCSGNSLFF